MIIQKMSSSILFKLLENISRRDRKDVKIFLTMPSRELTPNDRNIAFDIIDRLAKKKPITDEEMITTYFTDPTKSEKECRQNWSRAKSRLTKAVISYFTLRHTEQKQKALQGFLSAQFLLDQDWNGVGEKMVNHELSRLLSGDSAERSIYTYLLLEKRLEQKEKIRYTDQMLIQMEQQLDYFYIEKKLRCLCERVNRKRILGDRTADVAMVKWVAASIVADSPIKLQLYLWLYKMMTTKDSEAHYQNIKIVLQAQFAQFDRLFLWECHQYLLNYCIKQVNKGQLTFASEYLQIINQLEQAKLFDKIEPISIFSFKNSISMALIAVDFDWANAFFERYHRRLLNGGEDKVQVVRLCQAQLHFYERDYAASERVLFQLSLKDPFHDLSSELLRLKLDVRKVKLGQYDRSNFLRRVKSKRDFIRNRDWIDEHRKKKLASLMRVLYQMAKGSFTKNERLKAQLFPLDWLWIEQL